MNWEQTIEFIRTKPEFNELVEKAYFEKDLTLNIQRFQKSEEFQETLKILKSIAPGSKRVLDIGSGNGISAISFALEGYEVVTVEPDPSKTIGAGAIEILKEHYSLKNIEILELFGEDLNFPKDSFDIVYSRQCLHHADNLEMFMNQSSRVLKKGGIFLSVRDHVIFNEDDKKDFLANHPLHHFYGGENAFTPAQYESAIEKSGLNIIKRFRFFDSVINYYPFDLIGAKTEINEKRKSAEIELKRKIKFLSRLEIFKKWYYKRLKIDDASFFDEKKISGRMYSYLAIKK